MVDTTLWCTFQLLLLADLPSCAVGVSSLACEGSLVGKIAIFVLCETPWPSDINTNTASCGISSGLIGRMAVGLD
jgi:hypothetical protein